MPRTGSALVVDDLNGDGAADVVATTEGSGGLWILQGTGSGTFAAPSSVPGYRNNDTIAAGNFDGAAPTGPVSCSAGSYLSGNACALAPAGSYSAGGTATSATPCPAGTYSSDAGAAACTPAAAGTYVSSNGATSAKACTVGYYSNTAGSTLCTPAPAGSYVPNAGATSATACPTHYWSEAGATSCFPLDTDNDGVPDKDDAYINSNLSAGVSVGACNAGVPNKVLPSGASFNDLLASAVSGAANHGATVSAVTSLANGWKAAGLISGRDHGAIVSCVAKSK